MKYIDADKLIAYLEKTMESYKSQMVDPTKYPIDHIDLMAFLAREYQAIIANVDSLQQEQPEEDLEREIRDYFSKWDYDIYNGVITMDNGIVATLSSILNVAHHFAEWGGEHLKK